MPRRLIVLSTWGCEKPFRDLYDSVVRVPRGQLLSVSITPDDTLVLEGGTDIGASFYGERPGKYTSVPDVLRDRVENRAILDFADTGGSILGICRGAQFVTAFLGGKLIQHVSGHSAHRGHPIVTDKGQTLWSSSLHHQMMYPYYLPRESYRILAHCPTPRSRIYLDGKDRDMRQFFPTDFVEPEIVWYPKIRALAIQGHPEYQTLESKFVQHCRSLVKEFIFNESA